MNHFASNVQLRWLEQTTRIHGDGTFQSCPDLFYQLYLIHGYSDQPQRMNPCAWVLLTRKNNSIYDQMLKNLKILAIDNNFNLDPEAFLTDFESAVMKAFSKHFSKH